MKNKLFAALLLSGSALAGPYERLVSIYEQIESHENEHIYLVFSSDSSEIENRLLDSKKCQNNRNYKKVTKRQWTDHLASELSTAYLRIGDQDDGYFSFMESLNETLRELEKTLPATLSVCIEETVPAYSDGHTETFVKSGGEYLFVHVLGYPD